MKRLLSAAAVLVLLPHAGAEEKEHPFKNARAGDWAAYKTVTAAADQKLEGTLHTAVAARTDKEVTLRSVFNANGMDILVPEVKIDLTKPYDPFTAPNLPKGAEARAEVVGEGAEKVKVGDKEYDCVWRKVKLTGKAADAGFTGEGKVWTSKAVPISGVVKMEVSGASGNFKFSLTMELADSGTGKGGSEKKDP
jgi:hypothetical protein